MDEVLGSLIHNLIFVYTAVRGERPTTLRCHMAVARYIKNEAPLYAWDINDISDGHIYIMGLRIVVDMKLTPGVLFVDGD